MFGSGYNSSKLKAQLKMAASRFQIASNKKTALIKQNMRAVAELLAAEPPKEEKARIKAESIIYDDQHIEAYDILQLECELLLERSKLIEFSKTCPPDLVSCISTLIYASTRVDIPELVAIRKQFRSKYGKKFDDAAMANEGGILNERVVTKLSVEPPAAFLVQTYMEKICEQYEVEWSPKVKLAPNQLAQPIAPPVGYSVHAAQGTGLGGDITADTGLNGPPQSSTPAPRGSVFSTTASSPSKDPKPTDQPTLPTVSARSRDNQDDDDKNDGYNGGGDGAMFATVTAIPAPATAYPPSVAPPPTAPAALGTYYNYGQEQPDIPKDIAVKGSYYSYEKPAPYAPSASSASSVISAVTTPPVQQGRDEMDNWTRGDPNATNPMSRLP